MVIICKVLRFGYSTLDYYINATVISISKCGKILGVFFDDDLFLKTHFFVKKSRQMCNLLLYAFPG